MIIWYTILIFTAYIVSSISAYQAGKAQGKLDMLIKIKDFLHNFHQLLNRWKLAPPSQDKDLQDMFDIVNDFIEDVKTIK